MLPVALQIPLWIWRRLLQRSSTGSTGALPNDPRGTTLPLVQQSGTEHGEAEACRLAAAAAAPRVRRPRVPWAARRSPPSGRSSRPSPPGAAPRGPAEPPSGAPPEPRHRGARALAARPRQPGPGFLGRRPRARRPRSALVPVKFYGRSKIRTFNS